MSGSQGDLFLKMLKENGIETIFMVTENKVVGYLREDLSGKTYITEHTYPWADPPKGQERIKRHLEVAGKLHGVKASRAPNKRMKMTLVAATGNFIELADERGVQLHATMTTAVRVQNALPPPVAGDNAGDVVDGNVVSVRTEVNNGAARNSSTVVIVDTGRVGGPVMNAAADRNTEIIAVPRRNIHLDGMDGTTVLPAIVINVQEAKGPRMDIEQLDDEAVLGSDDEDLAEEKKEDGSISSCTLSSDGKCSCAKCDEKKMPGESGSAVVSGQSDESRNHETSSARGDGNMGSMGGSATGGVNVNLVSLGQLVVSHASVKKAMEGLLVVVKERSKCVVDVHSLDDDGDVTMTDAVAKNAVGIIIDVLKKSA